MTVESQAQRPPLHEKFDIEQNRVLTLRRVAEMLGISTRTLRRGKGPKIIRLSERRLGIRVKDLKEWLDGASIC
jgi:predicted DNA-binding transcriptional regulator AlpA